MTTDLLQGSCHCGTVKFEVRTGVTPAARCNCSLCRRKGALMTPPFAAGELKILRGEDALTLYQFNTRMAKHYFCKHCGIYPFHQTRKDPQLWRVNIGCLEGVDPYALEAGLGDGAACLWLRTREAPKPQDVVREPRHIMTLRRKGDVITAAAILIEGS